MSNSPSESSNPAQPVPPPAPEPSSMISCVELLLRNPAALAHHIHGKPLGGVAGALFFMAVFSLAVFGFVVGTFSGGVQLWAAPLKICGGMLFAALICFPSLYIFALLGGIQVRLASLACILLGCVALTGVLLLGFAPVVWVFSQSTNTLWFFGFLNLVFWAIGLFFGLGFLNRFSSSGKNAHLFVWSGIFLLVCLQMTATLRPIVGASDHFLPQEKKFFVNHWFNVMSAP